MNSLKTSKTTILFYSNCLGKGGAHQSMLAWFDLLRKQPGIELKIMCAAPGWFTQQLEKRGLAYEILPMPAALGKIKHGSWNRRWLTLGRMVAMGFQLPWRWMRAATLSADVVVLTGGRDFIMLLPLVLRKRATTVTIPQTTDWAEIPTCRTMCQLAAKTYAISESVAASIVAMGIKPEKVSVLPLIYTEDQEVKCSDKANLRRELGLQESDAVIGMTGVIRPHKGQRDAILILEKVRVAHPRAVLLIAGAAADTPESLAYEEGLKQLVAERGLGAHVRFLGWREDVPRVMRAMDLMVVPSHDFEGVPRVILEALEAGLPLVASDLTQFREVIGAHDAGALYPVDKHELWAGEISRLFDERAELQRRSAHARDVWRRVYSADSVGPRITEAFASLAR